MLAWQKLATVKILFYGKAIRASYKAKPVWAMLASLGQILRAACKIKLLKGVSDI